MTAPESRHDRGLAVDRTALGVGAGSAGKILARKQQVLMAEKQRVDAVEPREVLPRVLLSRFGRSPGNAGVAERDNEIDAAPEFADRRPRRLDDVDGRQSSADMGLIPLRDLRRRSADHAQLEPARRSGFVDESALDDD